MSPRLCAVVTLVSVPFILLLFKDVPGHSSQLAEAHALRRMGEENDNGREVNHTAAGDNEMCLPKCAENAPKQKDGWKTICTWKEDCGGCAECPSSMLYKAHMCMPKCAAAVPKHEDGWKTVCSWQSCGDCPKCSAIQLAGQCLPRCAANVPKKADGWKTICTWERSCGGCPDCLKNHPNGKCQEVCGEFARKEKDGWKTACTWKHCDGCGECSSGGGQIPGSVFGFMEAMSWVVQQFHASEQPGLCVEKCAEAASEHGWGPICASKDEEGKNVCGGCAECPKDGQWCVPDCQTYAAEHGWGPMCAHRDETTGSNMCGGCAECPKEGQWCVPSCQSSAAEHGWGPVCAVRDETTGKKHCDGCAECPGAA